MLIQEDSSASHAVQRQDLAVVVLVLVRSQDDHISIMDGLQ